MSRCHREDRAGFSVAANVPSPGHSDESVMLFCGCVDSSKAAGIPLNDDYNGASQEGISFSQVMMRDGVRSSAASAYLAPVRSRPNLQVLTRSLARRIVVAGGRAVGSLCGGIGAGGGGANAWAGGGICAGSGARICMAGA